MNAAAFLVVLALTPAAPPPKQSSESAAIPYGTIAVCAAQGARPITGSLTFTLAAPAAAGGSHIVTVAPGACATPIFYPAGTAVSIVETVPSGDAVTAITFAGSGTLTASSPTAASATVSIGTSSGTVTFTTTGPAPAPTPAPCKVPNLFGLTLTTAKARLKSHACTLGLVRRASSKVIRAGFIMAQSPVRNAVRAHGAPVNVTVSRG
jgi:hypothetical protein